LIAYAVLLATLAFSLISAVFALRPRLSHHEISERSLFYFGDIHGMETADYVRAFMGLSEQAALDQVLTQVHVNAKIVQKKYLWTRRAATGYRGVAGRPACVRCRRCRERACERVFW
jgi:hypothetical protein